MNAKIARLHPLFAFLVMEFLAIVSFGLGGNNLIFYIIGFALAIFGGILTIKRFGKNEIFSLLFLAIPVLALAVFVSFGTFSQGNSILVNIGAFLGIISFFALGLFLRRTSKVNIDVLLLCIGGGLALLVLISTIYTWFQYGMFYGLIYKNTPIYFYNAHTFNVTEEQGWLNGFSFSEVTLRYSGLFGVLLTTGFAGMLFINPKRELPKFIISGAIGFVGLLALITAPNLTALLFVIPMMLVAGIVRVLSDERIPSRAKSITRSVISISFIVFVVIAILFFAFAFLNANGYDQRYGFDTQARDESLSSIALFVRYNEFFRKLFNNGPIMVPIDKVLNQSAITLNFFGFINSDSYPILNEAILSNTKVFEIEIIKEGGIFAFIVLFFFLVFVVQNVFRYVKSTKDSSFVKGVLVTFMFTFLLYCSLNYESFPFVHQEANFNSLFRSLPGLILLFVIGFTFYPDLAKGDVPVFEKELVVKEDVKTKQESVVNDDEYSFSLDESEEKENEEI